MRYICIKCDVIWIIGEPGAELSGGLCDRCITQYVREKQKGRDSMTASERLQKFALRQSAVIGNIACQHIQITLKEERKGSFCSQNKIRNMRYFLFTHFLG